MSRALPVALQLLHTAAVGLLVSSACGEQLGEKQVDGEKEGENEDLGRHDSGVSEGDLVCNSVCVCESCSSLRALINV